MRQRVQRLIEGGVMQIVAVTDPLELGFGRQAMVGIRVSGPVAPVADAIAELDEVDYVVVTAGSFDVLAEVVAESDEESARDPLRPDPHDPRSGDHRDVRLPPPPQADLLLGRPVTTETQPHLESAAIADPDGMAG